MKCDVNFYLEVKLKDIKDDIEVIKKSLTKITKDYMTDDWVETKYFFVNEIAQTIILPHFYPIKNGIIKDKRTSGSKLNDFCCLNKNFSFREGQSKDVDDCLTHDILTLTKPPGSGKTIIGAATILKRNTRALILVDQDKLKTQWIKALNAVFEKIDISETFLSDDTDKNLNFDVCVTTIQNVIAKIRKYGIIKIQEIYRRYNIGFVIFDECHAIIGPEKFSEFGFICNSRYILAMSATPRNDIYFQYWLGSIVVGDNIYKVCPNIILLDFDAKISSKSNRYICWDNKYRKDRHANILFSNKNYLEFISNIVLKSYLKNRQILVITDYNKLGIDRIYNIIIKYIPENKIGKFIGGCDENLVSGLPVILSNYKMLQKGTDIPTLDTLVMASELGNEIGLEQTIGRLLRLNKGIMKKSLLVFDINETSFKYIKSRRENRLKFYKDKKFNIF